MCESHNAHMSLADIKSVAVWFFELFLFFSLMTHCSHLAPYRCHPARLCIMFYSVLGNVSCETGCDAAKNILH